MVAFLFKGDTCSTHAKYGINTRSLAFLHMLRNDFYMCSDGDMMSNMRVTCDPHVQKPFKNTSIISILINDKGKKSNTRKDLLKKMNKTKIIREYRQYSFY